ncbi:SDR family oxidoreductase [Chlorobium sp. KB01]|uniref:SDR family oxidoreductase n=1 Tax=Chlorobium sp. KB01 TaxID=1917528 RepID=UPI0009778374|nr:SDR family oxidoreductase [Chlorobium sp. KB01]
MSNKTIKCTDPLFDVSREIVIITGIGGQLGYAYAKALLQRDARVVGLDIRSTPECEQLTNFYPDNFLFLHSDVTDKGVLQENLLSMEKRFGSPTVLINNAAIDAPPFSPPEETGPFEEYPEASWDKVIDVNLKGVYLCCQVFGAAMAQANNGSIINIASIYGVVSPDQNLYEYRRQRGEIFYKPVAYSASKSGILNLTRYLAVYWGKRGVRVNSLTIAGVFNHQEQPFLDAYCGRIPVGRMADANDYNGAILFFASESSRYMTGSNMVIDGGWTAI